MEIAYKYMIIFLATIAAGILFFAGYRGIKSRKRNLFYSTLIITLAFLGCGTAGSNSSDYNGTENNSTTGKDDPRFIRELNETDEWKEFRMFWKSIDMIEPGKGANENTMMGYIYEENMDYEKNYRFAEELRVKTESMKAPLQRLSDRNLLDTLETKMLLKICNERIEYICYGFRSMMTRMIVHPGVSEKERTLATMEFRIDTLLNLEKQGKLDTTALNAAMNNIILEIEKFGIIDIIGTYEMYRYFSENDDLLLYDSEKTSTSAYISGSISSFEKSYANFMESYKPAKADEAQILKYEQYVCTKKELDAFMATLPRVNAIMDDLIRND